MPQIENEAGIPLAAGLPDAGTYGFANLFLVAKEQGWIDIPLYQTIGTERGACGLHVDRPVQGDDIALHVTLALEV
eukprot:scaffold270947_cov30-Tisochrysis_lutea.AAC.3